MDLRNRTCSLCLIKCENYKSIEGNMKTVLNMLLPTIEFTVVREPVMCKNCEEMLWKCFAFKQKCLNSYDESAPLADKDAVKFDLKDVCLRKNTTEVGVPENHELCGFCMNLVKSCYAVSLEVDKGRVILKKMIEQCLPELDLSVFKNPIICANCHRSLEDCFRFVTNCLAVEEKNKKYFESLDIDSKNHLNSDLHSIMRSVEASDIDGNIVDIIEAGKQSCMKIENPEESQIGAIKLEQMSYDDNEYVNVIGNKNEGMFNCAEEDNMFGPVKAEEIFCAENGTKPEDGNVGEIDDQKCILKEEIEIKTDDYDFNRVEESIIMKQTIVDTSSNSRQKWLISEPKNELIKPHIKQCLLKNDGTEITYQCECGSFQRSKTTCPKRHLLIHKASSEVTKFNCDFCPYRTRWKKTLQNHLLKHTRPSVVTMFACNICSFHTKYKESLKVHSTTHKAASEITIFKCDSCSFQTRWNDNLKRHALKHMDPSEVTMFKCDSCPFQARKKDYLKKHLLLHMDPSDVPIFTCDCCSYRTKYKGQFKRHSRTHKATSEVTMFKCDFCPYQTQWKKTLKNHVLKHMSPSEVTMFACDICSFQTKYKESLKVHSTTHKAASEITMFKCDSCSFQTRWNDNLKRHAFKHMDPSEVTIFKCDSCPFQAIKKDYLKKHMLKHMDPSKVTMFICDSCPFQTRRKDHLKSHVLKHMDASEVTMFTCDSCPFQTRWKENLKSHTLKHMDPSEVTMFTCDFCSYQTKYKDCLKRHIKIHKATT